MIFSILTFIFAFFCLIVLMVIHEFGHFIMAKKFGAQVDEFGIGYPPRIFGKKVGDTIYSINWVPFGAFVRIRGEEGGFDDYRSFSNLKIWKRALIVLAGVIAFWFIAIILFTIVFAIGTELPIGDQDARGLQNVQIRIISVSADSPAGKAGLKTGDSISQVKSQRYESAGVSPETIKVDKVEDFQNFIKSHSGEQITLTVNRKGQSLDVFLVPRVSPPEGQGALGVALERVATLVEKTAWYMAPVKGAAFTWEMTINSVKGLYRVFADLFTGKGVPEGAEFAGPLGITIFMANAASYGAGFFLYFVGAISVFVAIFNLFPIPALDGGKLIFLAIEKIKGKPVSVKTEQIVTLVFFTILILLSIFITIKFDIPRFADFLKSSL